MNAALLEAPTRAPHALGTVSGAYARDLLRSIGVAFQARASGVSLEAALEARVGDEGAKITRALAGAITRGSQAPAISSVPGWAAELVPMIVTAFFDVLAEQGSALAALPMRRYTFGPGTLRVPMRASSAPVSLAAAFRAEGAPIRVGALSLLPVNLTPKSLGILSTTTVEMISRAGDTVLLDVIRQGAATDAAKALDGVFFGSDAATDASPAGIQSDIAAGDTAVSSGATAANIRADLKGMLARLLAHGYGSARTCWVMSTLNAATLCEISDEAAMLDRYLKTPIVSGPGVPNDVVFLIDCAGIVYGSDLPEVDIATESVLHEEADPDSVLPIASGDAGAGFVATPTRSVWQTHCAALKLVLPVNWQVGAAGSVQTLTGIAW